MEHASHCPLDCPDACSLRVEVVDDRVVAVDGTEINPLTEGYICGKVRRLPEHLYGEDRLLYPAVRRSGAPKGDASRDAFERVSWDEALDRIARSLVAVADEHGSESILPFYYGGSNGLLTQDTSDVRFFRRLGASNLARTVCAVPSGLAAGGLYGKMPGVAFADYPDAELIIVWGCNPGATGIHALPWLRRAQDVGAKVVVVDPRRNRLARTANIHIAPWPGTDLPVALSMIDWLFRNERADLEFLAAHATGVVELRERAARWPTERAADVAGLRPEQIENLARLYADAQPAIIRCGWGLERNRNGCSAVASVLALPAVAGKFGVRGGGYTMSNSRAFDLRAEKAAAEPPTAARTINMNRLGQVLLEEGSPRVNALFVYNCNPVATMPDQQRVIAGLQREDLFTVVFDQVHTDTARYADILLPATCFVEHSELSSGYGAMVLQHSGPVATAAGEARSNTDVFHELCQRMGLAREGDPGTAAEMVEAILSSNGGAASNGLAGKLDRDLIAYPTSGYAPIQFKDVVPLTDDEKVHLVPADLDAAAANGLYGYRDDPGTEEYPLALISPATRHTVSSTFGQLRKRQVPLQINPVDALARSLEDGDVVRVFNDLGEMRCYVDVTENVRPGVVMHPKGMWSHNTLTGTSSNSLTPSSYTDIGDGACFNDARVQVERG